MNVRTAALNVRLISANIFVSIQAKMPPLFRRADIVVDTLITADTVAERQALMTLLVKIIMAEVVMNNVNTMVFRIVLICSQVAEPPAVHRSSSLAAVVAVVSSVLLLWPTSIASSRS